MSSRAVGAVLALAILAACGGSRGTVSGVVVDVIGDLSTVRSFAVVTEEGERVEFVPAPGLVFEDGAPLSHLVEHLRSGEPVRVRYEEDAANSALRVARGLTDG